MCLAQLWPWLVAAGSLLAHASLAQRTPLKLLAPANVAVQPAASAEPLGQPVPAKATGMVNGQPTATSATAQTRPIIPQPLYLVNASIIVNGLGKIRPMDLDSIEVYKGEGTALGWRAAAPGGIINLTLKPGVKIHSVALAKLKRQQHLTGPVRFELDGRPLADIPLRIATSDIARLEIGASVSQAPYKVLNIILVPERHVPSNDPPGTIRIRGVAGR